MNNGNNENKNNLGRRISALTLAIVMVAGGLTFAVPGMEPVYAANANLYVSAEGVGNFAGIQVIEIVIDDPDRSDTDASEGRPNVEINGDDVYVAQATDGNWYAYVVNQEALNDYPAATSSIFDADTVAGAFSGSNAIAVYGNATTFLDGFKDINTAFNNEDDAIDNWPLIQSYDISSSSDVTITYGTGGTAQSETIRYEYDDEKDIALDRDEYPENSFVFITLDDSLLNLSPTANEIWVFNDTGVYYASDSSVAPVSIDWELAGFEEGPIALAGDEVMEIVDTEIHDTTSEVQRDAIILKTSNTNDNVFVNYDNTDQSGLIVTQTGEASIEYNAAHSVIFDTFNGFIDFVGPSIEEWLSGVELALELTDEDRNLNSRSDETLDILVDEVPYIEVGSPITIGDVTIGNGTQVVSIDDDSLTNSKTASITIPNSTSVIFVNATWPTQYQGTDYEDQHINHAHVLPYINYDFSTLGGPSGTHYVGNATGVDPFGDAINIDDIAMIGNATHANFVINIDDVGFVNPLPSGTVYFDLMFFGQVGELADVNGDIEDNVDRVNDAFYRFILEETDDNTAKFEGSVEYIMINQLNVFDVDTYDSISTADDSVVIIVNDDMDGNDSIRVSYLDVDSTTSDEVISVQEEANTHSGSLSVDQPTYSSGNTITVTLEDADLNTDSDTIQTYDVSINEDWVGNDDVWLVQMSINDLIFDDSCDDDLGLYATGFTLEETGDQSGVFIGTIKLPALYCDDDGDAVTTNGLDVDFDYQDYSDASGKPNETSDSASIQSNTGSVSLDRTVYPVPFADGDFVTHPDAVIDADLGEGNVILSVRVDDPDFNISASGEDTISTETVKVVVSRGAWDSPVTITEDELLEIDPQAGIFEVDIEIAQGTFDPKNSDGSDDTTYTDTNGRIHQGDILTVTYTDPNDASGDSNTVTDSATFDLRNAVMQSDKSVYIIGSDAIITLIEPDLNLDSGSAETWSLDLINWDSDAGDAMLSDDSFSAQPSGIRETGDDSGIFQVIIEIPDRIEGEILERGEQITLEYQDQGPAGADYVGDDDEDVTVDIFTSNFGASVELDQKVYTWTDKVYVTIVSPDHNFDSNSIDEIGGEDNEITISTRDSEIDFYKLVETSPDTGIFTGEVILTGFDTHDADGDGIPGDAPGITSESDSDDQAGPTDGKLRATHDDGLTVSFESSDGDVRIKSSLIRWNIGEVQFLEASYAATSAAVVRVIDPDMNLNPEAVDSFDVNVWSDTAAGGISLSVTETNEATGIFEGSVFFTTTDSSSGSRLAVQEGDTVTAEYEDNTLPDPYTTADELDITATSIIGTSVPPLERAPVANLRAVDAFDNALNSIQVDQQVSITADLANGQDKDQTFAYLVQVQNESGVTVSLSWITGSLTPGQNLSSAVSWIPEHMGDYTVTAFVWESVTNPTALSPPVTTVLTVN